MLQQIEAQSKTAAQFAKPVSKPYKYGWEDALHGHAFAPECFFTHKSDKIQYALGYESVRGASEVTRQFTHSVNW